MSSTAYSVHRLLRYRWRSPREGLFHEAGEVKVNFPAPIRNLPQIEGDPMKRRLQVVLFLFALSLALFVNANPPTVQAQADSEKKFEDFDKLVKGAKEYDGLFKLYHKDDRLYAEIQPHQLDTAVPLSHRHRRAAPAWAAIRSTSTNNGCWSSSEPATKSRRQGASDSPQCPLPGQKPGRRPLRPSKPPTPIRC